MSGKIDLAELADMATWPPPLAVDALELLALVAAVRAAREFVNTEHPVRAMLLFVELHAALAPITDSSDSSDSSDSAEVSDGE